MNRLVIVGNGFDLAHGLPTGYCDFINNYWVNILNNIKFPYLPNDEKFYEDDMLKIRLQFDVNFYDMETIRNEFCLVKTFKEVEEFIYKYDCNISFKNAFFKKLMI